MDTFYFGHYLPREAFFVYLSTYSASTFFFTFGEIIGTLFTYPPSFTCYNRIVAF